MMQQTFTRFHYVTAKLHLPWIVITLLLLSGFLPTLYAYNTADQQAQNYIHEHQWLAVAEMKKAGVPASIKLAQAMLETGYGTSRLAKEGKNHFGIKCKSYWVGDTLLVDDDAPQECFRKYATVQDSYKDHSEFLQFHRNGYYSHLFQLSRTDYVGWAIGLQSAGYATNPTYADRLIELITRYQLYQYDYTETAFVTPVLVPTPKRQPNPPAAPIAAKTPTTQQGTFVVPSPPNSNTVTYTPLAGVVTNIPDQAANETAAGKKNKKATKNKPIPDFNATATQKNSKTTAPPVANNQTGKPLVDFNASMNKPTTVMPTPPEQSNDPASETGKVPALTLRRQTVNGIKAVVPNIDTDIASVAASLGFQAQVLYRFNETPVNRQVKANVPIFLDAKKGKSPKGLDRHIVQPNQSMYDIAQLYGIKLKTLLKANNLPHNFVPREGMVIKLR